MELGIALRQSSNICQPVPIVVSCTVIMFSQYCHVVDVRYIWLC